MLVSHYRGARSIALVCVATALLGGTFGSSSKSWGATSTSTSSGSTSTGASTPGLTSSSITLGQIADITGPIPGLTQGTAFGMDAWAAYVNSTGGIDGRKVVIDHKDSALSCDTFTSAIQSVTKSDFALVGSAAANDTCGAATLKANPLFPDLPAFFIGTTYAGYPNVFVPSPQPPGWRNEGYIWVKQKYGSAATQKFAGLYATVTAALFKQQVTAAKTAGYKMVYSRGVGYTDSNFTADILRMKSLGIEVVDTTSLSIPQNADFLQEAAQQNFHPDAVISEAYDNSLLKLVGNPSYANNIVLPLPLAMFLGQDKASVPEITTMTKWLQETHPGAPMTLYVDEAWAAGMLFQQAMQKAGSTPTQAGLLSALKGINAFTANGLLPKQSTGKKVPSPCLMIARVQKGKFVRIDPPKSGFICSGKYVLSSGS